jgi:hypothetical protein
MKRFAALVIGAALLLPMPVLYAGQEDCFKILSEDDLVCRAEYCPGVFDAGDSVRFRMAPGISERKLMGPPVTWMNITVLDGDRPVLDLPDSFYIGYSLLAQGDVRYWMIGEYTGGMHCCARYHFFSRPAPEHTLRYLGATAGSAQGIDEAPFSCRDGTLFLQDWDTRFLYFHTPYAQSLLQFPTHYRLTPSSLSIDNLPFRDRYLDEVKTVEADMKRAVSNRESRPVSLLLGKDKEAFFSDELGQFLVKRTLLYLYAKQDKMAWKTLERDVRKLYRQDSGLKPIRTEIEKILAEGPY